jgi:hypothetical protein
MPLKRLIPEVFPNLIEVNVSARFPTGPPVASGVEFLKIDDPLLEPDHI